MPPTPYYEDESCAIYHGDCRDILPYLPEADLVLTDPPYAEATHAGARSHRDVNVASINFASIDDEFMRTWLLAVKCRGWTVANVDWRHIPALESQPPTGMRFVRFGIWVKPNGAPQFTGDRPATGWEAVAILHADNGKMQWNGGGNRAVWTCNVTHGDHPTEKPLRLVSQWVSLFSNEGALVVDPFSGSGTTLVAARNLGRRAIGIEIEERYCEIAVERLAQQMLFAEEMAVPLNTTAGQILLGARDLIAEEAFE